VKATLRPGRRAFSLVAGMALILVPVMLVTMAATPPTPADKAVENVTRQALNDIYDAATFKYTDWKGGQLAADRVRDMHAKLDERLSKSMTGDAYAAYSNTLHATIDDSATGRNVVVVAGGVDKLEFHGVTVDGERATVSGRAHAWVQWVIHDKSVKGTHSARPEGWEQFAATVVLIDGEWLVESIQVMPLGI
jgi:hypothetical protein